METIYYFDGEPIPTAKVEKYNIASYCESLNGKWRINFVGFVISKSYKIVSFPKHLEHSIENEELLKNLFMMINRHHSGYNNVFNDASYNNFPLKSYLRIIRYYQKFGLYVESNTVQRKGYGGKINWKKTLSGSRKIISNNSLIIMPFILDINSNISNILTESMKYCLTTGYTKFGKNFSIGIPFNDFGKLKHVELNLIIKKLSLHKNSVFKDVELRLIDDLVFFLKWVVNKSDNTSFITTHFYDVWELMINSYLENNMEYLQQLTHNKFDLNNKPVEFIRKKSNNLNPKSFSNVKNHRIEYDHIGLHEDYIFLMDSKYHTKMDSLDYKQISYHLFIHLSELYKSDKNIFNSLLIPCNSKSYYKIQINLKDNFNHLNIDIIDDLIIYEIYLNIRDVILSYLKYMK